MATKSWLYWVVADKSTPESKELQGQRISNEQSTQVQGVQLRLDNQILSKLGPIPNINKIIVNEI